LEESIELLNNIDTQEESNVMSKKYVKIWQDYHGKKLPLDMEIHHIDGNHQNNQPENLLAVTIDEHLNIHKQQNDYGAVQAILMRLQRTNEQNELIKECASKHQKLLIQKGEHNFQKLSKEERSLISKAAALKTVKLKIGIHAINANSELAKQNGKNARQKLSRDKELEMMKVWHEKVKGSKWWVNPLGERKRSKDKPGEDWKEGMYYES
jgi:hypothetical protein